MAAAPLSGDPVPAWEAVARHLPGDALALLGPAGKSPDHENRFLHAVATLDNPPLTEAKLTDVAAQLTDLARGDDEIADAAAYLTGRLYQVHFPTPDPVRAAHAYEQLAARHPQSYWAQLGLVKLGVLQLYVLAESATPAARIAVAESLLPRLTVPELRRDLHIVIGRAKLFHGRPLPEVLEQLVAADRIGGLAGVPRADLQVQIAELSLRAGDWPQADVYYRRFLDENEVDARAYQVKQKLAVIAPHLAARQDAP
ncbi:MAG: hypothetical protein JSS11_06230 [Verrucomicrobia bacterium]|nr:hypothetical protein [Verrucomicrobiota bacterium]